MITTDPNAEPVAFMMVIWAVVVTIIISLASLVNMLIIDAARRWKRFKGRGY